MAEIHVSALSGPSVLYLLNISIAWSLDLGFSNISLSCVTIVSAPMIRSGGEPCQKTTTNTSKHKKKQYIKQKLMNLG